MKKLFLCFSILLIFSNSKAQTVTALQSPIQPNGHLQNGPIKLKGPRMGPLSLVWKPIADRTDGYDEVNSSWYPEDSETYYYDANANDTAMVSYSNTAADPQDHVEQWANSTLNYYTYDANGHQLISGQQSWVSYLEVWRNETQTVQTYDAAGDRTDVQDQSWDTVANQWVGTYNSIYSYDANHNNTEVIYQYWDSAGWENVGNSIYTYNDSNQETQETDQGWNAVAGQFYNYGRYNFTYTSSPTIDSVVEIYSLLDAATGVWNPQWRDISFSILNNAKAITETVEISQGWDTTTVTYENESEEIVDYSSGLSTDEYLLWGGGFWIPSRNYIYTYDSKGNNIKEILYSGDSTSSGWAGEEEVLETYDADNNLTEYLDSTVYGNYTIPHNYSRTFYYYKSFNSDVAIAAKNELNASIVPNPLVANEGTLNVNYDEGSVVVITIYNEQGSVLSATTRAVNVGKNNIDLPVRNMASGNYFLQVVDQHNGKTSVLKLTKE
jgi:hypothetical protein